MNEAFERWWGKEKGVYIHPLAETVAKRRAVKVWEASQRHLPESVEMIIEAAREYEIRMAAIARDDKVELEDLVDSWEMDVIIAIRNRDKGRQ